MKKSFKPRGKLAVDNAVYPELLSFAQSCGWTAKSFPKTFYRSSDEFIAGKIGRGEKVLLTHDKFAHCHNVKNGFIGYIEYGQPTRKEFANYMDRIKQVLGTLTSKDIRGFRIVVNSKGELYLKIKMSGKII